MINLTPIPRQSLCDSVYDQLRQRILSGQMAAGTVLPAERRLCEMLGVNRGALREALKRLQEAGLVSIQHGGNSRVVDFFEHAGLDVLPSLLVSADGQVDVTVARSIVEMRAIVAEDAARRAAERAGPEVHDALADLLQRMTAVGDDLPQRQGLAMEFWRQIILGSGNVAYRLALNSLQRTYVRIATVLVNVLAPEFTRVDVYRTIADAVQRRDPQAAAAKTRQLLAHGTRELVALLDALDAAAPTNASARAPRGDTP